MKRSTLEELSNKSLVHICTKIEEKINVHEFDEEFDDVCTEILKFYGIKSDYIDLDYIFNIIKINSGKSLNVNDLIKPILYNYTFDYDVSETQHVSKTYRHQRHSYMISTTDFQDSIRLRENNGDIDYYDGREVNYDVYDSEITDLGIDRRSINREEV